MSKEVADDTIKWIYRNFTERNIKIMFWGGEPLVNLELVLYLLDKWPQVPFCIVTNGFLIDENVKRELINHRSHLELCLSVANVRDQFPDYMDRLKLAIETCAALKGDVHYVSADSTAMFDDFKKLDAAGIQMIRFSLPKAVDFTDQQMIDVEREWKKIIDHVYFTDVFRRGKTSFDKALESNIARAARNLKLSDFYPGSCGVGRDYITIDTTGDIYGCDWFCGLGIWKMGNIKTGLIQEEVDKIKKTHKDIMSLYDTCDISKCGLPDKRLCTRAFCLAENIQFNGNMNTPRKSWCQTQAMEYKIWKYFVEKAAEKNLL